MRIIHEYSHLGGSEILHVKYPIYEQEIYTVINKVKGNRIKISEEKTKMGKKLFSPIDMNQQFNKEFKERGYREIRDTYNITIPESKIEISGAYKQIDFVKGKSFG